MWYPGEVKNVLSTTDSMAFRGLLLLLVFVAALLLRLDDIVGARVLQDSVGPYWAAIRLDGRAHASPYGAGLLVPYLCAVQVAGSLWEATNLLAVFHALAAPVAAWAAWRMDENRWVPGLLFGLVVAADPGLIDTFLSGAEGYLAAMYVGLVALCSGWLCWVFFALAVANHPLALLTLPLLIHPENLTRRGLCGLVVCGLLVGSQMWGWGDPGVADAQATIADAIGAYVEQGGAIAVAVLVGPFAALFCRKHRGHGARVLLCGALLLCAGAWLGYLRDHHLRLLTIPALMCWMVLPRHWIWLLAGLLAVPNGPTMPPESGVRGSTLGLVSRLGQMVEDLEPPMVVDRVWVSGGPAVEPSALMLDLYLRGWGPIGPGNEMVVVVAGEPEDLGEIFVPGSLVLDGHGFTVARAPVDTVRTWSRQFCGTGARLGGAWDALSVLYPSMTTDEAGLWWECP